MSKKKILVITGTRAEYGLLKPLISAMKKSAKLKPEVLITGMHTLKKFGNTLSIIKKDGMPISCTVAINSNNDMLAALSKEIVGIKKYCQKNKPDSILVLGDRDEAFAAAIVGIHLNVPVIHISGGDLSGPTVDHYLRNAITVFSKLHLTQTNQGRKNVIKLGALPKNSFVVGSLGLDGLKKSQLLNRKKLSKIFKLNSKAKWLLFLLNPTPLENTSISNQINPALNALKKLFGEKIIIYPNSDTGSHYFIKKIKNISEEKNFYAAPNLERNVYLSLLNECAVLIGNTTSGLIEAEFLKKPFVNIGNRQKNRERGINVITVPYNTEKIIKTTQLALSKKFQEKLKRGKPIYQGKNVSIRMVRHIENFITKIK